MLRLLLTITALTTAIAIAACGDDGASTSDATSLVPARSLIYAEVTLRPEGDQKAAIEELISKFPGEGSAGDRIRRLMQQALAEEDSKLSYEDDIEPWLGDEAAFFMSGLSADGEDGDFAVLVATEDEDATIDAMEKDGDPRRREYRGHDLYVHEEEQAAAVAEGWFLVGTPRAVRTAIDTVEGDGEPIEDDDRYRETLEEAPDDRLGFFYMNTPAFLREFERTPEGAGLGALRRFFEEPILVTADADDAGVRFEATVPKEIMVGFPVVAAGSGSAGELPADSWLAFAQPDLGRTIEAYVDVAGTALGGREMVEEQVRQATGLDLEEDVISWMGDWGGFVRGTTLDSLDGAVMIETSDEAASGRFIDAIVRLIRENPTPGMRLGPLALAGGGEGVTLRRPDVPQPIHIFQRDGKVVAAYGDAAARDAVDPDETLADSPAYQDAEEALGGDYAVSFFVAVEPILALAESAGASSDESFQEVKPYLEPLGALVGGAREDGDMLRTVLALTVK
jgi:Protein of unknown function (DUF3352)